MSEVSERYGRVAAGFGSRLAAVPDDRWAAPTPCSDWDVRQLVAHVIATHARVASTVGAAAPGEADPEGDLLAQWSAVTGAVAGALADPARSSRTVSGMFGEQTFESLVGRLLCADTLLHTWDLARATGQDQQLDHEAVARALEFLGPLDEGLRRPGGFGPRIPAPDGADDQTRLLCFSGRLVA